MILVDYIVNWNVEALLRFKLKIIGLIWGKGELLSLKILETMGMAVQLYELYITL